MEQGKGRYEGTKPSPLFTADSDAGVPSRTRHKTLQTARTQVRPRQISAVQYGPVEHCRGDTDVAEVVACKALAHGVEDADGNACCSTCRGAKKCATTMRWMAGCEVIVTV